MDAIDLCPQTDALWMAYAMAREYGGTERQQAAQRELCEKLSGAKDNSADSGADTHNGALAK